MWLPEDVHDVNVHRAEAWAIPYMAIARGTRLINLGKSNRAFVIHRDNARQVVTGDGRSPTALPSPPHIGAMELLPSVVALQQEILRRCAFLLPVWCLGQSLLLSKELWHISHILVHHGVYAPVISQRNLSTSHTLFMQSV